MEDILILRDQYFTIEGIDKKHSSMRNEYCLKIHIKVIATIHQFLGSVYFMWLKRRQQKAYGKSCMIYMRKT
jgi:hypothetical protein